MNDRRVCLVTGASGTLGSAFCRERAEKYDIAAVWYRRRPVLAAQDQQVVDPVNPDAQLPENDHPVLLVRANVANQAQISRLVQAVLDRFGRIDVVINAARFATWAPLLDSGKALEDFDRSFRVNVRGPLAVSLEVARQFWSLDSDENRATNRSVVNISSTAGLNVYPNLGQSVYSATKAALNILTCHLAGELAPLGVRANVLAPNTFPAIVPIGRVLDGIEVLIESDATGQILMLDGAEQAWL